MTRLLTPDLLWEIPRIGRPSMDAAGTVVVVPVTTHDADGTPVSRLWAVRPSGTHPLTSPSDSATHPAVSPDGSQLAFVRKVGDLRQIHVMALDGGESQPVTDFPLGAHAPQWFPDGTAVACLGYVYRDAQSLAETRARRDELENAASSARTTEGRVYRYWDVWLTEARIPHIYRVSLDDNTPIDLTPESDVFWEFENTGDPGRQYEISPDGHQLVYSAWQDADPNSVPRSVIRIVNLTDGTSRVISADGPGSATAPRWYDASTVVYGRQWRDDFYADRVRLIRHDLTTGVEAGLADDWDRSPSGWTVEDEGTLVFSAEDEATTRLYRLDPDDRGYPVPLTNGGSASAVCSGGGRIVYLYQSITAPPEIYELVGGEPVRLTGFTANSLDGVRLGTPRSIMFSGADGDEVQMYVLDPPSFDAASGWPLVHLIHGGPHSMFGDTWHWRWNSQVVAAAGYVVAMVNFHGSTSWGQGFASSILGRWGDQPARDIEAATDALIEAGGIDPGRLAVTGGSYGGYLAAWITSQTDRYRCAIAHAAVTNLAGMYASDVVFHRATAYGAEYWDDPARVDLWSPSAHAQGYSTPTLVIHGEQDYRVPVGQGLELYGMLKAKGVETRLVYYPDENHWIRKRSNSIHWYGEFVEWLDRHLGRESP